MTLWWVLMVGCVPTWTAEASLTAAPGAPRSEPVWYPGPCRAELDHRNPTNMVPDGIADVVTTYTWDEARRLVGRRIERLDADTPRIEAYRYDQAGRLEWRGIETVGPGAYVQLETLQRDPSGRLLRTVRENPGKGKWHSTYHYDDDGRLILREDGVVGGRVSFRRRYVHEGDLVVREEVDNAGAGMWPKTVRVEHDAQGRAVRRVHEWSDRDDNPTQIDVFSYDEAGRLARYVDQRPYGRRDDPGTAVELEYDAAGNVLSERTVRVATGVLSNKTVYDYACWGGLSAADPVPTHLLPWEATLPRLHAAPDLSF